MPSETNSRAEPTLTGREILYCAHVMGLIGKAALQHAKARGNYAQKMESLSSQIRKLQAQLRDLKFDQMNSRQKRLTTTWQQKDYSESNRKMLASTKANRAFRATALLEARSWQQLQQQRELLRMQHKEIDADAHVTTRRQHFADEAWQNRMRQEEEQRQRKDLATRSKRRANDLSRDKRIPKDVRQWLGALALQPNTQMPDSVHAWLHRHPMP